MELLLYGIRSLFALIFGVLISAAFCGVEPTRRIVVALSVFTVLDFGAQVALALLVDVGVARMLYPLIAHLPLVAVLVCLCGRQPLHAFAAVLLAYQCCELPYMIEGLIAEFSAVAPAAQTAFYVLGAVVVAILVLRFAAKPISELYRTSTAVCLSFSSVPLLFYLWDYITNVYTNWMVANSFKALLTVSGMFSLLFMVFAVLYGQALSSRATAEQERRLQAFELKQSKKELEGFKELTQLTATYRHDMRHKLVLLKSYVDEEDIDAVQSLLSGALEELEELTPVRYCANPDVNILLSHYAQKAQAAGIDFRLNVKVPSEFGLSSSELCSLLGNAFENALEACTGLEKGACAPFIDASLVEHRGYLLFSVHNSCTGIVEIRDGLPCRPDAAGHGLGAWSIRAVAERHGGQVQFSAKEGSFLLRAAIPLE